MQVDLPPPPGIQSTSAGGKQERSDLSLGLSSSSPRGGRNESVTLREEVLLKIESMVPTKAWVTLVFRSGGANIGLQLGYEGCPGREASTCLTTPESDTVHAISNG